MFVMLAAVGFVVTGALTLYGVWAFFQPGCPKCGRGGGA